MKKFDIVLKRSWKEIKVVCFNAIELPERFDIIEYLINLKPSKQQLYNPGYILGPVELKTLKTYIKTNLANGFIYPSKSPARALILFVQKSNNSLRLCVDYYDLNNLIIKN